MNASSWSTVLVVGIGVLVPIQIFCAVMLLRSTIRDEAAHGSGFPQSIPGYKRLSRADRREVRRAVRKGQRCTRPELAPVAARMAARGLVTLRNPWFPASQSCMLAMMGLALANGRLLAPDGTAPWSWFTIICCAMAVPLLLANLLWWPVARRRTLRARELNSLVAGSADDD